MKPIRQMSTLALVIFVTCSQLGSRLAAADGGSIQNHLTLDILPLTSSPNNPIGSGLGVSYDRYHDALKSDYELSVESGIPFSSPNNHIDLIVTLGFFTEITRAFSIGARVGVVANNPGGPDGIGALAFRLPALFPDDKKFMGFFAEEIDLGISGAGDRYASFRLCMLLL